MVELDKAALKQKDKLQSLVAAKSALSSLVGACPYMPSPPSPPPLRPSLTHNPHCLTHTVFALPISHCAGTGYAVSDPLAAAARLEKEAQVARGRGEEDKARELSGEASEQRKDAYAAAAVVREKNSLALPPTAPRRRQRCWRRRLLQCARGAGRAASSAPRRWRGGRGSCAWSPRQQQR